MENTRKSAVKAAIGLLALLALAMISMSCPTETKGSGGSGGYVFRTPPKYREMITLAGGMVSENSDPAIDGSSYRHGVFINGRAVTLSAFKIAKYETTYELWKEVYDWAVTHGYSFANAGKEGFPYAGTTEDWDGNGEADAETGTGGPEWDTAQKKRRPVTNVNWRDVIVWCNAYSELSGKEPVYYYTDSAYISVLKTSTSESGTGTAADTAKVKAGANGYRLPTEAEWEYAARGGDQTDTTGWNYTYAGTTDQLGNYAWYDENSFDLGSGNKDYGAHPVGTKRANSAGLYDMSGNVWEWCWDWHDTISVGTPLTGAASGSSRVVRGGSWSDNASSYGAVANRSNESPTSWHDFLGFRFACP